MAFHFAHFPKIASTLGNLDDLGVGQPTAFGIMLSLASASLSFQPPAALPRAQASRAAVSMGVETKLGATGPLGYWDPLGFVRSAGLTPARQSTVLTMHRSHRSRARR